jgi:uncharacterized protein (DUF1697 family)
MKKPISYVALLRGINVGGANNVSMAALKATFEKLGLANVRTYINSGNLLFQSDVADSRALETTIEAAIAMHFSVPIRVMVRSAAQMAAIMAHLPKSWSDPTDKRCNVMYLSRAVDKPSLVKEFSPKPDIEELHYFPGVLLWSARLTDLTKSRMIKVSSLPIYQDMTIRGLNTTRKLCEMLQEESSNTQ